MEDELEPVVRHYETTHEEHRLAGGIRELELVRTQEVLRRHLPNPPASVLDVGGGTGAHAAWLVDDGYTVRLVDLSPRHVEYVRETLAGRGVTAELGDARALSSTNDSVDVALLLGPLYHLTDRLDRIAALAEARRVVRPGGIVAAAAISRFASLFDGLARGFLFDADFRAIVRRDLEDGRHINPSDHPNWFTTAYFHHPDEVWAEVTDAGLELIELVGLEGLAGWLSDPERRWADEDDRRIILDAVRSVEAEPTLLGLSAHLLAVARVPD